MVPAQYTLLQPIEQKEAGGSVHSLHGLAQITKLEAPHGEVQD
jgi:hypothetical protein